MSALAGIARGSAEGRRAIFVDRDGTLNEMVYDETHGILDSPRRPEQVRMVPGAGAFVRSVKQMGYQVIVVSNQPGIAKGTLSVSELEAVNDRLRSMLEEDGDSWDALYYCPHHPRSGVVCDCRKPAPGLLVRAAQERGIDLASSWMVGDGLNDIQAGRAAGCRTILVTRLKLEQVERFFDRGGTEPSAMAPDLAMAFRIIGRA